MPLVCTDQRRQRVRAMSMLVKDCRKLNGISYNLKLNGLTLVALVPITMRTTLQSRVVTVQITLACSFQRRINLVDYSKVRQMTNGHAIVCDVNGFLTCSKYSIYNTENYVGPISGTCVKGNAKNRSLCSWVRYPAPENYGEDYVGETVFCDESNGFYCNVIESERTNNQSGYCPPFRSVTAGKRASWGLFCENGL